MFFKKEKINEEMLKVAFSKIKNENEALKKRLEKLEKTIEELNQKNAEKGPVVQTKQLESSPIVNITNNPTKEVELVKSTLTQSEKEILYIFTMSKDKSYTYEEIADIMKKSAYTVKAQIQSMIKKGIKLSYSSNDKGQRSFYLDNEMFERIIMSKNK